MGIWMVWGAALACAWGDGEFLPETLQLEAGPEGETDLGPQSQEEPSELTLAGFFSEGWDQEWVKRARGGRAPDMALLRVTTNFLEREVRVDYANTRHVKNNTKVDHSEVLNGLIAYGLNRRLMIEVISNYQWNEPPSGSTATKANGAGGAALARFQLADTYDACYGFQVRVSPPNRGVGQTATTVSPSLAGFQDLQVLLGLDRVGLYESVTYDSLDGPHAGGARTQDVGYALSVAKSWTEPKTPWIGNFTTFLEGFATTDLNGPSRNHTGVTLTPGLRFWFAPENSLTLGVEFPISRPYPFGELFRLTYIVTF